MNPGAVGRAQGALAHPPTRAALRARARALQADPVAPGPVPSPCLSVCQMDPSTGWCAGCLRTLDEIADWSRLGEAAQRRLWSTLAERAQSLDTPALPPLSAEAP